MASGAELPSREGELLAGKYRLEGRLGVGGMGEVYRAHNELIGRHVAIKLLHPVHAGSGDIVARFMREARAANLVRHPNVVDVLDLGQDTNGTPFIVQELLAGEDLGKYLDRQGGKLSLASVASVMVPVIEAVALAHSKGVVHRDLKPENVFLHKDPSGEGVIPKVLDFGISKIGQQPGDIRVTTTGVSMGTPAYMSPEQVQGLSDIDARTDVWALGVMLQELVTGALPFRATAPGALFLKICTTDPEPIDVVKLGLPKDFAVLVSRCLRRDREARYPSAAELLRDLKNIAEARSIDATRRLSAIKLDDAPASINPGANGSAPASKSHAPEVTSETLVDKRRPHGLPATLEGEPDTATRTVTPGPTSEAPAGRVPSPTMNGVVRDTEPRGTPPARRRGVLVGGILAAIVAAGVGVVALRPAPTATPPAPGSLPAEPAHATAAPTPNTSLTNTELHPAPTAPAPGTANPNANANPPTVEAAAAAAGNPPALGTVNANANTNANANAVPEPEARGGNRRHGGHTGSTGASNAHAVGPGEPAQGSTGGHRTSSHAATSYE